jgi:voltage-gated potassium channel
MMSLHFEHQKTRYGSKERFLALIFLIMGLLVVVPVLKGSVAFQLSLDIFLSIIFIVMAYSITHRKSHVFMGTLLATLMLGFLWSHYFFPNPLFIAIGKLLSFLFVLMVVANILWFVFRSREVTGEVIYAAIVAYLLMALMWAFLYEFLELTEPTSFNVSLDVGQRFRFVFFYYSSVTITTLGYGDVTPVTDIARSVSILEAVVGQLYMVVIVAWLVGTYKPNEEPTGRPD